MTQASMTGANMIQAEADPQDEGFAVYVHWPFCLSKCPYCDFNSHAVGEALAGDEGRRWAAAYQRELATVLDGLTAEQAARPLTSVFFGGGTPSLMPPSLVAALLEQLGQRLPVADALEVTLEANPGTYDAGRFADFAQAGVTRLSLGVQSLRPEPLRFLERQHDVGQAVQAIETAHRLFPRVSFDLIYARPGQSLADWRQELAEALTLAGEHLSLYQLTVEQGTRFFHDHAGGAFALPEEEAAIALYEVTQEVMAAAGLPAYEVSNHARLAGEGSTGGACRHNLTYWRGGDYLAIGPGAHGRLTGTAGTEAFSLWRAPLRWREQVETLGQGREVTTLLTPAQRGEELLLMGLRLNDGISRRQVERLSRRAFADLVDAETLAFWQRQGLLEQDGDRIRTTAAGRLCLNSLLAEL